MNLEPWVTDDDYFGFEIYLNMLLNSSEIALIWYNDAWKPYGD